MFNLQGSEIIIILLLALVVLGPEKLPDAIRKFSQTYGELKKMGNGFQTELKSVLDEPMRELRDTADLVQRAADPKRVFEEAENEAKLRSAADAAALAAVTDIPVSPEALAVSDPVAAAAAAEAGAADLDGSADGGATKKPVNQVALSMARGPIQSPESMAAEFGAVDESKLTDVPQGAPASMAPPPPGSAAADVPPPPAITDQLNAEAP